jgi:hypothetical protein
MPKAAAKVVGQPAKVTERKRGGSERKLFSARQLRASTKKNLLAVTEQQQDL